MYRIGIGDVEFPMKIEFPEEVFGDEENILWREAKKIKEHYEILHQIPVLLDMGRYSQIGIITKDTIAGMELVRSIILQDVFITKIRLFNRSNGIFAGGFRIYGMPIDKSDLLQGMR